MRRWLPALILMLASLAGVAALRLAPIEGEPVAILFAPGTTADAALLRTVAAGGAVLRSVGWSGLVIARSGEPQFISALYGQGAWVVMSAAGARGCGEPSTVIGPRSI